MKTFEETLLTFAVSANNTAESRLQNMNPNEYLQHQLANQRSLQEELDRLRKTAIR